MIVLAARYRVSFSVVTTTLRQHGARTYRHRPDQP